MKMKAAVLREPSPIDESPLTIEEIDVPSPGPDEILLKVKTCGVCHTDLHTVEGDLNLPKLPVIPGHQVIGEVAGRGEKARLYEEGTRLGVPWLHRTCGECRFCRKNMENLCENPEFTGLHRDGGFAEYMTVPEDFAYPVPEYYSDAGATPLLCGGVIGYRALELSEVKKGRNLGLYGFGNSAHLVIQIAIHRGCDVYVFTRSEDHRRHARELGAAWAGTSKDNPPELMDSSIIFAPAGPLVIDALEQLDKGGTLALAGIYMSPIPEIDYEKHLYYEKTVRSVANSTRRDVENILEIAPEVPVKTDITTFPFEKVNEVLAMMKESKFNGDGVLIISDS